MAATISTVNFWMNVPGLSQVAQINALRALANECVQPWTILVAGEPNSNSARMVVTARDGSTTTEIKDTMLELGRAHSLQGFAVYDVLASMSQIRAMGQAAKKIKKVFRASVIANHAYTAMIAADEPSPPEPFFPPAKFGDKEPVKTVALLNINPPGPDNPTFNTPDDQLLWGFGENMLTLCSFAARQDVQPFITKNNLKVDNLDDVNTIETKVAFYTFNEYNDIFGTNIIPDSAFTYNHDYTTTSADINLTLISDLLKGMSLDPVQLANASKILSEICNDVKTLKVSWEKNKHEQSMCMYVRHLTKNQVGKSQLAIRFFLFTFTDDTFKLTVGKSSVDKLAIHIGFLDKTGYLNRQSYENSDPAVLEVLSGGLSTKLADRFKTGNATKVSKPKPSS